MGPPPIPADILLNGIEAVLTEVDWSRRVKLDVDIALQCRICMTITKTSKYSN